jgi:hypothetical protein
VDEVRREIKDSPLLKEAINPYGIEDFGHVQEHLACEPLFAKIPGYSFNDVDQLQVRAMSGSEPKLLVPQ